MSAESIAGREVSSGRALLSRLSEFLRLKFPWQKTAVISGVALGAADLALKIKSMSSQNPTDRNAAIDAVLSSVTDRSAKPISALASVMRLTAAVDGVDRAVRSPLDYDLNDYILVMTKSFATFASPASDDSRESEDVNVASMFSLIFSLAFVRSGVSIARDASRADLRRVMIKLLDDPMFIIMLDNFSSVVMTNLLSFSDCDFE